MLPTFDHTIQVILALTPLVVAIIGAAVAIAQILAARDRKAKEQAQNTAPAVATGVTTPTPAAAEDDHADDAIAALRDSRDLWKTRAEELRDRLVTANAALQQHGLPTV